MSDFIAAQDQSYAAAIERIAMHPKQFILIWGDYDIDDLGMVLFAHPEFVLAAREALTLALLRSEPTVRPPEAPE